jgi:uncharacterized membrane protein
VQVERTVDGDVAFGIRQLVDISEKALSPAINDPTTAVQAIGRISDLMERLAHRSFPRGIVCDTDGVPRLFYRPLRWEELVHLAFDELRDYGASSRQVARRLRAALLELMEAVPDPRRPPVEAQLAALDRAVQRHWGDAGEDLDQLLTADVLGVGGGS